MTQLFMSPELSEAFRVLLDRAAGLYLDAAKQATLEAVLRNRLRARRLAGFEDYLRLLRDPADGPRELQALVESLTVHETSFFRNQQHFQALQTVVMPALAATARAGARPRPLRIWSAGCATGEEAYSLAIACLELPALAGLPVQIIATDISGAVLEVAREGTYTGEALRYLSPDRIRRWFTRADGASAARYPAAGLPAAQWRGRSRTATSAVLDPTRMRRRRYRINDPVRALVTFSAQNLARLPFDRTRVGDCDLIVCENVLIYLHPDLCRRIVQEFYECLNPGGYLFLGYSESLWRISDAFTLETTPTTFYYRRPLPRSEDAPSRPRVLAAGRPATAAFGTQPLGTPSTDRLPAIPVSDPLPLIHQGYDWLEQGSYANARAAFEEALRRSPTAVDALVGLARIHANQGAVAAALAACRQALSLDALCEDAHLLLALLYRQQHQTGSAIDHLEKAVYANFASVAGHFHLAEIYRGQENWVEAGREYRRTLWALDRTRAGDTISGLPVAMIRRACEQQLDRIRERGGTA